MKVLWQIQISLPWRPFLFLHFCNCFVVVFCFWIVKCFVYCVLCNIAYFDCVVGVRQFFGSKWDLLDCLHSFRPVAMGLTGEYCFFVSFSRVGWTKNYFIDEGERTTRPEQFFSTKTQKLTAVEQRRVTDLGCPFQKWANSLAKFFSFRHLVNESKKCRTVSEEARRIYLLPSVKYHLMSKRW